LAARLGVVTPIPKEPKLINPENKLSPALGAATENRL
jgi:hypothetical protein